MSDQTFLVLNYAALRHAMLLPEYTIEVREILQL